MRHRCVSSKHACKWGSGEEREARVEADRDGTELRWTHNSSYLMKAAKDQNNLNKRPQVALLITTIRSWNPIHSYILKEKCYILFNAVIKCLYI